MGTKIDIGRASVKKSKLETAARGGDAGNRGNGTCSGIMYNLPSTPNRGHERRNV